ncbi:MAG: GDSL-type esterase/lipase family protein [Oscillospiraceae bacterium]
MRRSKLLAAMTAAALFATVLAGCSGKDSSSGETNTSKTEENTVKIIALTSENVKLVGRTWLAGDGTLWTALSGTGIAFDYTGKKLDLTLTGDSSATAGNDTNYARVAVYVDGARVADELMNQPEKQISAFTADAAKTVHVEVVKLSETAMSTVGIKPITIAGGESIVPQAAKAHKIEIIGDSITCGYGVDDEVKEHHFSTATEDFTKSYAYKTAQALDADYSAFSISGYGIISGYTGNGTKVEAQTIPQYYNALGFSYNQFAGTNAPQALTWDFTAFQPEAIVINLGTNDATYTGSDLDKRDEYCAAYIEFLKQVREKNPNAKIFCTLGIMGNSLFTSIEEAVLKYTEATGDENIATVQFQAQDGSLGYAADWHPTEATHEKAAEFLTEQIKTAMGW